MAKLYAPGYVSKYATSQIPIFWKCTCDVIEFVFEKSEEVGKIKNDLVNYR